MVAYVAQCNVVTTGSHNPRPAPASAEVSSNGPSRLILVTSLSAHEVHRISANARIRSISLYVNAQYR